MYTQCTDLKIDHDNRVGYRARASSRARARSRAALCVDSRALPARARPRRRDTARHAFFTVDFTRRETTRRAHASFHDAIRPGEARHPHRARDSTSAMSATTTRAATAAPCVRAAHRTTNKTVAQSHRARRFTVARAVVDSENTAADRGTGCARATRRATASGGRERRRRGQRQGARGARRARRKSCVHRCVRSRVSIAVHDVAGDEGTRR